MRWHNTFAQVAILAKHYMYTHPNEDMQSAIHKVGDTLRAQGLLKGPSQEIPMHAIEQAMGDLPAGKDTYYVGKDMDGKTRRISSAELEAAANARQVSVQELINEYGLKPEK